MKTSIRILALLFLSLTAQAQVTVMQPLTTFGPNGDGSLRPSDVPFLTVSSQLQRGIAYNPITGHLLVVDRSTNSSVNNDVYVVDGTTGAFIKKLDNNGILAGGNASFLMNLIGVADDGAIYVANLSNATDSNSPQFRLYRWASEDDPQTFVFPQAPGVADPGNGIDTNSVQKRWGDTLSVRGSGTNTQVIVANRGTLVSIFTPTDSSMTAFAPNPLRVSVSNGALGYGLSFGAGDTFWGTAGASTNGPLYHIGFDLSNGTTTNLHVLSSPTFPGTISPILCMPVSNLLAGITMVASNDVVRLYDISNPASPVLLDRKSFATANNNNTFSGALAFGTNGLLYALDSDNGIMAFTLTNAPSNPLPPAIFLNPLNVTVVAGDTVTLTVGADSSEPINYQWLFGTNVLANATNATLTITNVSTNAAGSYSVMASNALGIATSSTAQLNVSTVPLNSLLAYDPFTNAPGATIAGQNNWSVASGQTSAVADSGSLSYNGLAASIGNKITWGTATMVLSRTNVSTPSGSIYVSYLYRLDPASTVPAVAANGGAVAGFQNGTEAASTYYGKVILRTNTAAGSSFLLGVSKRGGENFVGFATNVALTLGDTVFIVCRYTFKPNSNNDDTTDLWINPDPSTFGASNAPPPTVGENGTYIMTGTAQNDSPSPIDKFSFRQSNGPSRSYVDEVRIGLAWSDVTPPVVVTAPTLNIVRNGSNVTVSWPVDSTGFTLEGTASFSPTNWIAIPYTNNSATINASSGNQFLRLRK